MNISANKVGDEALQSTDDVWVPHGEGGDLYSALYFGERMYACEVEDGEFAGLWELRYMGERETGRISAEDAMDCGSSFAMSVQFKLQAKNRRESEAVVSCDPVSDLSNLIDACDANPKTVAKMKALIAMIRDETETLREGVLSLNPDAQLAREAELMDRVGSLCETIKKAL